MAISMNIDQEWENFISSGNGDDIISDDDDIDQIDEILKHNAEEYISANIEMDINTPKASNIYISTKTKIAYLNTVVDLKKIFWDVPIINYSKPQNGVIKKQMKFNSFTKEELDEIQSKINYDEY